MNNTKAQIELLDQLVDGKINHLQYLLRSEHKEKFLSWCSDHNIEPDNDIAEFYCDFADRTEPVEAFILEPYEIH